MKKIYYISIIVLILDMILYFLIFHSGIVFPYINPSIEEYKAMVTSFPRDTSQKYLWIYIHWPIVLLFTKTKNWSMLIISAIQYPILVLLIGKIILKLKRKT